MPDDRALTRESDLDARADGLASSHTARELARMVARAERVEKHLRGRIDDRSRALGDIARGGYTAEGAREVARKALFG